MHRSSTVQVKTVLNNSKLICWWILMWEDNRGWSFFLLKEALLWTMDSHSGQKWQFKAKNTLIMNLFLTNTQLFTSQDVNWWTGVIWITCGLLWCFYQLFGLSFWRHPFTAEEPSVSKWYNATFLQICSDEETKLFTSDGLRVSIFSFWVNCFFKLYTSKVQKSICRCLTVFTPAQLKHTDLYNWLGPLLCH